MAKPALGLNIKKKPDLTVAPDILVKWGIRRTRLILR
jgi:hypothetical protein